MFEEALAGLDHLICYAVKANEKIIARRLPMARPVRRAWSRLNNPTGRLWSPSIAPGWWYYVADTTGMARFGVRGKIDLPRTAVHDPIFS